MAKKKKAKNKATKKKVAPKKTATRKAGKKGSQNKKKPKAKKAPKKAAKAARGGAKKRKKVRSSKARNTKSHRLPAGLRHVVEQDEPRELAGDASERAFVGADTEEDEPAQLGEEFVRSVTSGEEAESEMEEEEAAEEQGGPFLETSASTEFGRGIDESNPADAEPAGVPSVSPAVNPKFN